MLLREHNLAARNLGVTSGVELPVGMKDLLKMRSPHCIMVYELVKICITFCAMVYHFPS